MERFDRILMGAVKGLLILATAGIGLWAAATVFLQCICWLRFGMWQPVPAFAVLLSPGAQADQLTPLGLFGAQISPLMTTPSLMGFDSLESAASFFGGSMLGITRILSALLNWPLSAWLVGLATLGLYVADAIDEPAARPFKQST
jgi:hypothetical protein